MISSGAKAVMIVTRRKASAFEPLQDAQALVDETKGLKRETRELAFATLVRAIRQKGRSSQPCRCGCFPETDHSDVINRARSAEPNSDWGGSPAP